MTILLKNPLHGCNKTILKYVKILKLQFNSSQTVHTELLRKPNENIRKNRTFNK